MRNSFEVYAQTQRVSAQSVNIHILCVENPVKFATFNKLLVSDEFICSLIFTRLFQSFDTFSAFEWSSHFVVWLVVVTSNTTIIESIHESNFMYHDW